MPWIPSSLSTPAYVGVSARPSSAQALSAFATTKLTLGTSNFDSDGFFDNANDRHTVPTGLGGLYQVTGSIGSSTSMSYMDVVIYKNGSATDIRTRSAPGSGFGQTVTTGLLVLAAADYIELYGQFASAASTVTTYTRLEMARIGS